MPPGRLSRYRLAQTVELGDGTTMLSDPEPFAFVAFADNGTHVVIQGDTLETVADIAYGDHFADAEAMFWVIADFQPEPIFDPTIALTPGRIMYYPSPTVVEREILSETRRVDFL